MSLEQKVRWLFAVNAVINWALSLRGVIDPVGMAALFGGAACGRAARGSIRFLGWRPAGREGGR